jgi:hypothetical protein
MGTPVRATSEGEAGTAMKELLIGIVRFDGARTLFIFVDAPDLFHGCL